MDTRDCRSTFRLHWITLMLIAGMTFGQERDAPVLPPTGADSVHIPASFPSSDYTPFGYIDNPYHSMVFNRSGILRSVPPLGFGWWRTDFDGSYGGAVQSYTDDYSLLGLRVTVGDDVFADVGDFTTRGIELTSKYHSDHMMSYDWSDASVSISLKYFLPRENTLSCLIELANTGDVTRAVTLTATHTYGIGDAKWWGSDGLTARVLAQEDVTVSKIWAYGDVWALGSSIKSSSASCAVVNGGNPDHDAPPRSFATLRGRGPIRSSMTFRLSLLPQGRRSILISLSRGPSEAAAIREIRTGLATGAVELSRQLDEDRRFWDACPVLAGDWPDRWKRGWVYDFETLRMNVRRPLGVFRHPWDGMQIHSPRMVLGETSIDMMTLSYADDSLAREVLLGTFEDALAPNVPCAREDGSVNMISSDGSECGTAPMWGFPFHVVRAIERSTGDTAWVRKLYPHLRAYINWWLGHRTDAAGWLHCNNSWESGQDGSKRFLVAEGNEGAVADFVRTVDVEASMAEAMRIMQEFAPIAGHPEDRAEWDRLAGRRIENVRQMFVEGWFRDVDGRTGRPIMLAQPYDVMMLAPLTCGVATKEHVAAILPLFPEFGDKMKPWLQWPPQMQTFVEAAWNAGARMSAAEVVAGTADRIYQRTDSRRIRFGNLSDPRSYRVPGVANEFWPENDVRPGGEGYGWGASLPTHIIRAIAGFREESSHRFFLAPSIPGSLFTAGKTLAIRNLHYRGLSFGVTYACRDSSRIAVTIDFQSPGPVRCIVRAGDREIPARMARGDKGPGFAFEAVNGSVYSIDVGEPDR